MPSYDAPPDGWPLPPPPPEPAAPTDARARFAGAFTLLGAAMAALAALLPWAHYADDFELSGLRHGHGWIVLGVAVVAAVLAGAAWMERAIQWCASV